MKKHLILPFAAVALAAFHIGCAAIGNGGHADMGPGDIVNGMNRGQIEWILGQPEAIDIDTAYYTVDGQRWQYVYEGDTLISYGPAG